MAPRYRGSRESTRIDEARVRFKFANSIKIYDTHVGRGLTTLSLDAENSASEIAFDVCQLEPVDVVGRSSGSRDILDKQYRVRTHPKKTEDGQS